MKEEKKFLYTKMKIFHFKEKLDSLPLDNPKILPPLHIRIKPTNACNHNCRYCAYRVDNLQLGQDMSVRDFIPEAKMMEIIEDLADMEVKAITFSGGGEPFCYPYLLKSAKSLINKKIDFACITNGSKLDGDLAETFAHKAIWLRVSIDGWDDTSYSSYRRVKKGEFTKVMRNLKAFKQFKGKCYLGASIVVDKRNARKIFGLVKKLKDAGVDSVKISHCIVSNSGEENNLYHAAIFNIVKEQIRKSISALASSSFEIFDAYHESGVVFDKEYGWCPYQQILPVIGADLNIYPCQDKAYNLKDGLIGTIKDRRFKEFWFSKKTKFLKINPAKVCNHHCVANEKNKMILEYLQADKGHLAFV